MPKRKGTVAETPKPKRAKPVVPDFKAEDVCKIQELISIPIAKELIMGSRESAIRLYDHDLATVMRLIRSIAAGDLKVFSFEDRELIGRCRGHIWGHLAAASVMNFTEGKRCIIVTTFSPEECSAHYAIKSLAPRVDWGSVGTK